MHLPESLTCRRGHQTARGRTVRDDRNSLAGGWRERRLLHTGRQSDNRAAFRWPAPGFSKPRSRILECANGDGNIRPEIAHLKDHGNCRRRAARTPGTAMVRASRRESYISRNRAGLQSCLQCETGESPDSSGIRHGIGIGNRDTVNVNAIFLTQYPAILFIRRTGCGDNVYFMTSAYKATSYLVRTSAAAVLKCIKVLMKV